MAQGRGTKVGATGAYGTGLEFLNKMRQKLALQVAERNKSARIKRNPHSRLVIVDNSTADKLKQSGSVWREWF